MSWTTGPSSSCLRCLFPWSVVGLLAVVKLLPAGGTGVTRCLGQQGRLLAVSDVFLPGLWLVCCS